MILCPKNKQTIWAGRVVNLLIYNIHKVNKKNKKNFSLIFMTADKFLKQHK